MKTAKPASAALLVGKVCMPPWAIAATESRSAASPQSSDGAGGRLGLTADSETAPIPTNSKAKDAAATKVLQEGVTGEDHGAHAAIEKLPDRIVDSRKKQR